MLLLQFLQVLPYETESALGTQSIISRRESCDSLNRSITRDQPGQVEKFLRMSKLPFLPPSFQDSFFCRKLVSIQLVAVYLIYLTSTSPCLRYPSVGPRRERKECMSSCGRRKDAVVEFEDEDEVEERWLLCRNQLTVRMLLQDITVCRYTKHTCMLLPKTSSTSSPSS